MGNNKNNEVRNLSLTNRSQTTLNRELTDYIHSATKFSVDSLSENQWNLRNLSTVFNNQVKEFDNIMLTILHNKNMLIMNQIEVLFEDLIEDYKIMLNFPLELRNLI